MGGWGSGEHLSSKYYRLTVEDCLAISLGGLELKQTLIDDNFENFFSIIRFYYDEEYLFDRIIRFKRIGASTYLLICYENFDEYIRLDKEKTGGLRNRGERWIMRCPACQNKVLKLFAKPPYFHSWKCSKCHNLTHMSSKTSRRPNSMEKLIANNLNIESDTVLKILRENTNQYRSTFYEQIFTEDTFMKQVGFKLSNRQIKELNKLSKEYDLPRSELIRRAVDEYLDKRLRIESKKIQNNSDN